MIGKLRALEPNAASQGRYNCLRRAENSVDLNLKLA
jgi:hypothetical protein